jgi:hypothetical protein
MTNPRWLDAVRLLEQAAQHFTNAAVLFRAGGFDGNTIDAYRANMALMHAMQCGHSSAEAAMKAILRTLGERLPADDGWHDALIRRLSHKLEGASARPALWNEAVALDLQETRRFRHRVIHGYESFRVYEADRSVAAAERLAISLLPAFSIFLADIEGDDPD